jgi:hypothetical protein
MTWRWNSWEELQDAVDPPEIITEGLFRIAQNETRFAAVCKLHEAQNDLAETLRSIQRILLRSDAPTEADLAEIELLVEEALAAGAMMFLYHKGITTSPAAYGFLHQTNLPEHWDRYVAANRILYEIERLVSDAEVLLDGYRSMDTSAHRFLGDLDLPPELASDFREARCLFSVGFDDVGLLVAGRGLEGVLRSLAARQKLVLEIRGKPTPAREADFFDIIEVFWHTRWKRTGNRLITPETKALLHYLRTLRNGGAHASVGQDRHSVNPRQTGTVVAETATRLWHEVAKPRTRLETRTVPKTW